MHECTSTFILCVTVVLEIVMLAEYQTGIPLYSLCMTVGNTSSSGALRVHAQVESLSTTVVSIMLILVVSLRFITIAISHYSCVDDCIAHQVHTITTIVHYGCTKFYGDVLSAADPNSLPEVIEMYYSSIHINRFSVTRSNVLV